MSETKKGKLILIPVTLGSESTDSIPILTVEIIESLNFFVVERNRSARRFIRSVSKEKDIDRIHFIEFDKDGSNQSQVKEAIEILKNGTDVGLMSEAGAPCIADPGNLLVQVAHQHDFTIQPLVGPSSILLALMASGMNGQSFAFHGYLAIKKDELAQEMSQLEQQSRKFKQTQLFMETPYRNDQLWAIALKTLNGSTRLGYATDLTLSTEEIKVKTIAQWKSFQSPSLHKRPTIFMLMAN